MYILYPACAIDADVVQYQWGIPWEVPDQGKLCAKLNKHSERFMTKQLSRMRSWCECEKCLGTRLHQSSRPRMCVAWPSPGPGAHQLAVSATAYVATPTAALISARGLVV